MGEQAKINYLMGGLSAELTTQMYVMKINSSAEFLEAVKLEDEAQALAREKRGKGSATVAAIAASPSG